MARIRIVITADVDLDKMAAKHGEPPWQTGQARAHLQQEIRSAVDGMHCADALASLDVR